MNNLRFLAAETLLAVTEHGRSLTESLEKASAQLKETRDKAWLQAVCFGCCRYYEQLDFYLAELLEKPLKAKDADVHALLMVGLYQLAYMRVPPHAAVAETVAAVQGLKKAWAKSFVNAVLRNFLRQQDSLQQALNDDVAALYAHPEWWVEAIRAAWPDQWQAILAANNSHPPLTLRINQQHCTRDEYLQHYPEAQALTFAPHALQLKEPVPVETLPGYREGWFSVQDAAAQLCAPLLQLQAGQRVLDACAAPGGKLTHILETEPGLAVCVAVDVDAQRMHRVHANLKRLGLVAECKVADVAEVKKWWDGQAVDRILLDAPCSASGVIRRHPDIKLLRQPDDIAALHDTQLNLLQSLWPLLKPGGLFLYATCSVFPEENAQTIAAFLQKHNNAEHVAISADWGHACSYGRQILPGENDMDGFYYCLLRKL